MSDTSRTEVPLQGGTTNRGLVFRVGDTVRRPRSDTSGSTEAVLRHLEEVGFAGAPRFLGVDAQGRQVLTYIPGEAVTPPYPAWALTDVALTSVAVLLRSYHEAVAGLEPADHAWPQRVPDPFQDGLISHNDPNLDNVVFREGRAVALIDFDLAGPGSRLWDLAAAARLWVPLRTEDDIDDARRGRTADRLSRLVTAYGGPVDPSHLLDAVTAHHDWSYDIIFSAADLGHEGFHDYLSQTTLARADRTRRWYERSGWLQD